MGLVAIADTSERFVEDIVQLLASDIDAEVRQVSITEALRPDAEEPWVVVVGPTIDYERGLDLARTAGARGGCTAVVIVTDAVDTDLLRRALKAGVADVIDSKAITSELGQAVVEAYREAQNKQVTAASEQDPSIEKSGAQTVTIYSTKGGVGKTVLATNLGTALASQFDLSVAIVDLDLQFGDVGIMLGLTPERTINDVVARGDSLDADYLRGCMSEHQSGLMALLAPGKPEDADTITTGRISKIFDLLSEMFDVVIVDTAATFDEVVLTALDRSDSVFGVTMMDVASIKNMRISLQKLEQLGYRDGLVKLVLNRADSKVWLQPAEVEKALGAEIFAKIPSGRVVPRSVNKGTPVVLDEPRSDVSKALVKIARGIAESTKEVSSDVS